MCKMNKIYGYLVVISLLYSIYYSDCIDQVLDLLDNERFGRRYIMNLNSVNYYRYVADFDKKVIKVVEGDKLIWEKSRTFKSCIQVLAYLLCNKIELVVLRLFKGDGKDAYKYYMRYNDGWIETVTSIFDEKLSNMLRLYILDITKTHTHVSLYSQYYTSNSLLTTFYSMKVSFIEVIEDDLKIWSRDDPNYECTSVIIYTRKNIRRLLYLPLKNKDNNEKKKIYFKK